MINQNAFEVLETLVGFQQPTDECTPKIATDLVQINLPNVCQVMRANEFLKPESVFDLINQFAPQYIQQVPAWSGATTYEINDRVLFTIGTRDYVFYSRQAANLNQTPAFDSAFWESDLSYYLRTTRKAAAIEATNAFFTAMHNKGRNANELYFAPLFQDYTTWQLQTNTFDKFVGLQFYLNANRSTQIQLAQIGLRFEEPQTIPFYLYHSSQPEYVQTFDITIADNKFNWHNIANALNEKIYLAHNSINNTGGVWILGFYEDDVIGNYYQTRAGYSQYAPATGAAVYLQSFSNIATFKPNLPPIGEFFTPVNSGIYTAFNLRINTQINYTETILQNSAMFAEFIKLETAIRILQDINNSTRINTLKEKFDANYTSLLDDSFIQTSGGGVQRMNSGLTTLCNEAKQQLITNYRYVTNSPIYNSYG